MIKDTGGPAFMVAELANIKHDGMLLRDYFAAKAMQALYNDGIKHQATTQQIAYEAYKVADEMLKARAE
jgi:hypothetical protein